MSLSSYYLSDKNVLIRRVKTIVIIPARYASTRFPGKPLAVIMGKPMIQHTFESACKAKQVDAVYIATDDKRIAEAASVFTSNIIMTSTRCLTGTDRCAEALKKIALKGIGYVINVQGDEPFIKPAQIDTIAELLKVKGTDIATLALRIKDIDDIHDANKVKVVMSATGEALYFSRAPIPHVRGVAPGEWLQHAAYYKHIGLYGFRADALQACVKLKQSPLEKAESLEQLRWLQNGYHIRVGITRTETIGIDTPADLAKL